MTSRTQCPRIVIAGAHSGVGKTSLSLALVHALKRRGLRVQTFKVGPDFLDPSYLALASGRPCYNLDGWMTGRKYVCRLFARATADADAAIIEGVMGLFDGADPATSEGSTAEIARWLAAPVLLVVNAHGMARSLAALVRGYVDFDPDLRFAGIIANQCGSERHADWLAESLRVASLPPLLGAIKRDSLPTLSSRHLGLVTADPGNVTSETLAELAAGLERQAAVEDILRRSREAPPLPFSARAADAPTLPKRIRLGVARDRAFHFYYPDNLEALERQGCELVEFSPLRDEVLPPGIDGLYFGGGYPEEHAEELAGNRAMIEVIRRFATDGKTVYAECGGLMCLTEGIETLDGKRHALVGLLPAWSRMLDRKKRLGYVEATTTEPSLWGPKGTVLRGHEFHYSELLADPAGDPAWKTIYRLKRRRSDEEAAEGYQRGRTLASYVHVHFASAPGLVESFVEACARS
ncbi:MAG: cobyrinate a,c-diamide synthase [Planctomycetota bacterium]